MSGNHDHTSRRAFRLNRIDQISALLWLIVGLVVIFQSKKLDYMATYGPGPGFLPFWLGVFVIVLGFTMFFKATFLDDKVQFIDAPTQLASYQILLVLVSIFSFIFLAEIIGFIICMGLLFFFLLFVVERRGWKISLFMAIVNPLIFWIVFEYALEMRFPPGLLSLF